MIDPLERWRVLGLDDKPDYAAATTKSQWCLRQGTEAPFHNSTTVKGL
jgi:hypothetical protein